MKTCSRRTTPARRACRVSRWTRPLYNSPSGGCTLKLCDGDTTISGSNLSSHKCFRDQMIWKTFLQKVWLWPKVPGSTLSNVLRVFLNRSQTVCRRHLIREILVRFLSADARLQTKNPNKDNVKFELFLLPYFLPHFINIIIKKKEKKKQFVAVLKDAETWDLIPDQNWAQNGKICHLCSDSRPFVHVTTFLINTSVNRVNGRLVVRLYFPLHLTPELDSCLEVSAVIAASSRHLKATERTKEKKGKDLEMI